MRFLLAMLFLIVVSSANDDGVPPAGMRVVVAKQQRLVRVLFRHGVLREQLRPAKASGVLLDWQTGKLVEAEGAEAAETPGSVLKPLLLAYGLKHGIVNAQTQVYCRRTLVAAGRSLPCTHPNDEPVFDAERALANSCNTWFAALARRMTAADLHRVLGNADLPHVPLAFNDGDSRVLTALGLANVTSTPRQLADAYLRLLTNEPQTSPVWRGLRESVSYGMAHNAHVAGEDVLGKTGTAGNPGEWWTHGWFAGGVTERFVLVVYVPRGDGGTAAMLAGQVFRELQREDAR